MLSLVGYEELLQSLRQGYNKGITTTTALYSATLFSWLVLKLQYKTVSGWNFHTEVMR